MSSGVQLSKVMACKGSEEESTGWKEWNESLTKVICDWKVYRSVKVGIETYFLIMETMPLTKKIGSKNEWGGVEDVAIFTRSDEKKRYWIWIYLRGGTYDTETKKD